MSKRGVGLILLVSLMAVLSQLISFVPVAKAEDAPAVVLDDATPSVDVVITPSNGAPGVVYLELENAKVRLTDSSGAEVLALIDKRASALAFEYVQGTAALVLRLERLPNVSVARAKVFSQTALPEGKATAQNTSAGSTAGTINGQPVTKLSVAPANATPLTVTDNANLLTIQLTSQGTTTQLTAADGVVLLTAKAGKPISGLAIRLAAGTYTVNFTNVDLNAKSEAALSLTTAPVISLTAQAAPSAVTTSATPPVTASNPGEAKPAAAPAAAAAQTCQATVKVGTANLRSGPGTAYTVLAAANQGETMAVGGRASNWWLVQHSKSAAWIIQDLINLSGECSAVPTMNMAVRNAAEAPVVSNSSNSAGIVVQPSTSSVQPAAPARSERREKGEHEDHDDDEHEEHGDDD